MDTVIILPTIPNNAICTSIIEAERITGISEQTVSQVRPWVRYFARTVDVFLFSLTVGFAIGMFAPSVSDLPSAFLTIIILFLWIFQEAILLANCGTTPGKWLFKIKVRNNEGQKLTFSEALNRSFGVWLKGMGAGIPLLSLIAQISSRSKLKRDGITEWDEEGRFLVTHGRIGFSRSAVVVLLLIGFCYLSALGDSIESSEFYAEPTQNAITAREEDYHDINRTDFDRVVEFADKWLEDQSAL